MAETLAKKIAVIYHADCPDGFGAAYSAWKKFGDSAEYFPSFSDTKVPDLSGKKVYFLDFLYPAETMSRVRDAAEYIVAIDHHVTNEGCSKFADEWTFDIKHSASVLAWKYFFPDTEVPTLFKYAEDVDLWKFSLPNSREISNAILLRSLDFATWEKLVADFGTPEGIKKYVFEGEILLKNTKVMVERLVGFSKEVEFEGYKCLLADSPLYHSALGNALAKKMPPIGIVWTYEKGRIRISLRSDGTVDVSKLAQKYGGGGHKAAAGFIIPTFAEFAKIFGLK